MNKHYEESKMYLEQNSFILNIRNCVNYEEIDTIHNFIETINNTSWD